MSKILNQLEQADNVLMAGHDIEVKKPMPDDVQPSRKPSGNFGAVERDITSMAPGSRDGGVHKKPERDCLDPLPYVWSM